MNLEALLASTVDGLLLGIIFGLTAMGLTLIFGVMKVINLSHGPVIVMGMYVVLVLFQNLGLNPYLGLVVALAFGLLLGIVIYFIAIHRVINAPELTTLLATYGVHLMIVGLATVAFTTTPRSVDVTLGSLVLGAVTLQGTRFAAVAVAVLVASGLYAFLYRTRTGKSIRAVANNRAAAELMGINSAWMLALAFGLGTMLATVSGGLLATLFAFTPVSGGVYEVKSFVIVVLGGLGNPTGALLGGIVIGLLESVTALFVPVSWVPIIEYVIFVVILLVAPNGLPEYFKNRMGGRA